MKFIRCTQKYGQSKHIVIAIDIQASGTKNKSKLSVGKALYHNGSDPGMKTSDVHWETICAELLFISQRQNCPFIHMWLSDQLNPWILWDIKLGAKRLNIKSQYLPITLNPVHRCIQKLLIWDSPLRLDVPIWSQSSNVLVARHIISVTLWLSF